MRGMILVIVIGFGALSDAWAQNMTSSELSVVKSKRDYCLERVASRTRYANDRGQLYYGDDKACAGSVDIHANRRLNYSCTPYVRWFFFVPFQYVQCRGSVTHYGKIYDRRNSYHDKFENLLSPPVWPESTF